MVGYLGDETEVHGTGWLEKCAKQWIQTPGRDVAKRVRDGFG